MFPLLRYSYQTNAKVALKLCRICWKQPTRRKTGLACSACQSFYRSHRYDFKQLVCKGIGRCLANVTTADGEEIIASNGSLFRFCCPKCRFERCLAVGMQWNSPEQKITHNSCQPSITEDDVGNLVSQFERFSTNMSESIPANVSKPEEIPVAFTEWLPNALLNLTQFLKFATPVYKTLKIEDRKLVITQGLSNVCMLRNSCFVQKTCPLGLNEHNVEMARKIPFLEIDKSDNRHRLVAYHSKQLKLSQLEWALAVVYLSVGNYTGFELASVQQFLQHLHQLHFFYLQKENNGNERLTRDRIQTFEHFLKVVQYQSIEQAIHLAEICSMLVGNTTDLKSSKMYQEMAAQILQK